MRFTASKFITIIIVMTLVFVLPGCSITSDTNSNTTVVDSEKHSRDLVSEISEKMYHNGTKISDDLFLIPSLLTQVREDNTLKTDLSTIGIGYRYSQKIKSSKTSLIYEETRVEITSLDGFTTEEVIHAVCSISDDYATFEINGNKCCAIFSKRDDSNKTIVNILFFTPTETGKCFVATTVDGLLDFSKQNVRKIYSDFVLEELL